MFEVLPLTTDFSGEIIQDADGEYFINFSHCTFSEDSVTIRTGTSKGYVKLAELISDFRFQDIDLIGLN
jgi:hypothetical protein